MTDFRADDWQPKPIGVANRLREAREAAGLQQKQLAETLGWDPAKLSKTESGARTAIRADDVRAWATATGMSDEDRDEVLEMLSQYKAHERSWRERMRHGRQSVQIEYARLYRDSTSFRMLQTCWIPGILQTPDYARQIFIDLDGLDEDTPHDIEADVQSRMRRREFLNDMSKKFKILITEGVLRDLIVDADVMRSQIQRLLDIMDLPNVEFGILPHGRRRHTATQLGFVIFDEELAVVEDYVIDTPYHGAAAKRFSRVMDRLWADAVFGDEARAVIRKAREDLPSA